MSSIRPAGSEDMPLVRQLLAQAGLPNDDFGDALRFYRLDRGGEALGWAGLERHGPEALLRSMIVPPERRGRGAGRELVLGVVEEARSRGAARLWLLTTDAGRFFGSLGFRQVARGAAPAEIQATSQFGTGCCSTASCMVLDIPEG